MLASIMMMENKEEGDDTAQIVRALHGAISCPDWQAASEAWETATGPDDCLPWLRGSMNREQSNCALANLTEIALAAGEVSEESRALLYRIAEVLDPAPGLVDQAIFVIASKNNRDVLSPKSSDDPHRRFARHDRPSVYH
ncbi:hypothetical protein [Henriciella marina]|uniref:hypothetical protein n=1 Tax=Henriciella marina TaxID=453851 RepID=UPI0003A83D2F|nr:hypothetical protein [Henriciella marina]